MAELHFQATITIDDLANDDVEMQAPLFETSVFLVLDTNVLLQDFEVIISFVRDVERLAFPVFVIIPGAVIYELDRQKNRERIGWPARRASAWILEKVRERRVVKAQANAETCRPSGNWKVRVRGEQTFGADRENDALILDCCKYFRRGRPTYLCSRDKNLCTESEAEGISTLTPSQFWSSREIAWALYGSSGIDLDGFGSRPVSNLNPPNLPAVAITAADHEDDRMHVDDEAVKVAEVLLPSHALDLLHIQVVEHFTRLLVELVGRIGGPEIRNRKVDKGAALSRHAPRWQAQTTPYTEWSAADCLEYLAHKADMEGSGLWLAMFLSKPYSRLSGARRGQDWSRRDWEVGLERLGKIGDRWGEASIRESLAVLEPHVREIFEYGKIMRPTGI